MVEKIRIVFISDCSFFNCFFQIFKFSSCMKTGSDNITYGLYKNNLFILNHVFFLFWPGVVYTGSESLQDRLGVVQTHRMILASDYVLCHLSTMWLQFQRIGRSLRWEWLLIWCVTIKYQRLSSIRVYLCQLSD